VPNSVSGWAGRNGNVLCVCPTCCAKMLYGSVEADNILEQVEAFQAFNEGGDGNPGLDIRLIGKPRRIRFTERHMLDLQEMLRAERKQASA
jgi:hypothetical protein